MSGTVTHIQRVNYVKSYTRDEKSIIQREQKLLLLHTSNQEEEKMLKFCREFDTQWQFLDTIQSLDTQESTDA